MYRGIEAENVFTIHLYIYKSIPLRTKLKRRLDRRRLSLVRFNFDSWPNRGSDRGTLEEDSF